MRIGIMAPTGTPVATPDFIGAIARAADDLGFHSFWAPEHVVFFEQYSSRYPYTEDGRIPMRIGGPIDPFQVLTFAAAVTSRIRLGTGICLVPQRNPVYTAKEVAGLDWLSNGRFDFGVGIGWLKEEFAAVDVPWADRAGRTREYIEVMRALWSEGVAEYHGTHYDLPPCIQHPKPVQQPHPPIFFGGESEPALERVAAQGQGWFGFDLGPEETRGHLDRLDRHLAARGRSRSDIQVFVSPFRRPVTPALVEQYEAVGVDQLIIPIGGRDAADCVARLEQLAKEAISSKVT
jgi:probable F420-dependent oxidoreductase